MFPMAVSVSALCITLVIVMDCVMTFFGSTANDAAFNAWLTDSTDSTNRGRAEGINSMMPLMAILVVFGGFMAFDLNQSSSWTAIFLIIGGVVLVIGIAGIFLIKEEINPIAENKSWFKNIFYGFRPSVVKANPILYVSLLSFAVFNISIQIFMPYLILYYNVSLGMDNYVLIMAPAIIVAAIVTAIYGRVYDKKGFVFAVIPSLLMLSGGYVLLYLFKGTALVFIGSLLMMCGYLTGMAVFGALIRDYTPEGKAGMFQGLRIVAQVLIPGVIGPAIGAAVLKNADTILNDDGTTSFIPNENIYLAALIALVALAVVLAVQFRILRKSDKNEKI
jgi:MFS family permease